MNKRSFETEDFIFFGFRVGWGNWNKVLVTYDIPSKQCLEWEGL